MVAPLLKWPGGKTRELPAILSALPDDMGRLVDPFVGGGALLFALPPAVPARVNDACDDLVALYRAVQRADDDLFVPATALADWWDAIGPLVEQHAGALVDVFGRDRSRSPDAVTAAAAEVVASVAEATVASVPAAWQDAAEPLAHDLHRLVPPKLGRMRRVEDRRGVRLPDADVARNVEGAVRAAVYTRVRTDYNRARAAGTADERQTARFLFLRELAYAAMFRFNQRGDFNVPYGGISYNRKSLADRVGHLRSDGVAARLATTHVAGRDFEDFLGDADLRPDDVVFLDPPYDGDFRTYDRRGFDEDDHRRLAAVIRALPCRFQMVVRDSAFVRRLYVDPRWHVQAFDHTYAWTIKDRNDRRATHLRITDVAPSDAGGVA